MSTRVHLLHVMTVPQTFRFLLGQTKFMELKGIDVSVVASDGPYAAEFGRIEQVRVESINMSREITPLLDLWALMRLIVLIRRTRPMIVHAHTPKGGLLGMLSSFFCRVPVRVYHLRGMPMETATGVRRWLLAMSERISCRLAHRVFCVGHDLRTLAIREGLVKPERIVVPFHGSGNGVDARGEFAPSDALCREGVALREQLHIACDAPVIAFVGRLVRDKGIVELTLAWQIVRERHPDVRLIIAGPVESRDALPTSVIAKLQSDPRVHLLGLVQDVRSVYMAANILVHPSHREGFPNVPLEAAALERPVVTTTATGCRESVVDGETGAVFPVGNVDALAAALERYVTDPRLRERHGRAGRTRVLEEFSQTRIWSAYLSEYRSLLAQDGTTRPPFTVR